MNFRPAGYSSDEDELDFENFSFHGETKTEKECRTEIATEIYQKRIESENTAADRIYNAVSKGNLDEILNEIKNGFDINSKILNGWTALSLAVQFGENVLVEELIKIGADVTQIIDDITVLIVACTCLKSSVPCERIVNIVDLLIKGGVDVKFTDRKRRTAFMFACAQGFIEIVKLLLPLSDIEAKDNQGWTGLFFAVNKNETDIVKFLIDSGANTEHIDIRNNSIKYYVHLNDNSEMLSYFPKNDFEISPEDFANRMYDYEAVFDSLLSGKKPDFKSDISSLLYGMKCQHFIPKFNKCNLDLVTFLTLTEDKLKELGVELSFERNRILQGLHNFHIHSWKKSSIPFVPPNEMFTTFDIFVSITNTAKHLIILEGTVKYLSSRLNLSGTIFDQKLVSLKLATIRKKIDRLKCTIMKLNKKAILMDSLYPDPADLINNKTKFKQNSLTKKLVFGCAIIFIFRLIKSKLM